MVTRKESVTSTITRDTEVFYGFYQNGERIPLLEENATMEGFYNEYAMESRQLKCIAEYDEKRSFKKGRCFFYKDGKLEKESWMENNAEQYVIREFIGNQMIEYYENGVKKYEGDYKMISLLDIQREGEGTEYDAKGEMTYKGAFVDGEPAVTFEPVKKKKGFMEEKQKGVTLCIGQFNPNGMMKDGICFEFKKGKVKKECIYANNTLVRVVREFKKHKMTEYDENPEEGLRRRFLRRLHCRFLSQWRRKRVRERPHRVQGGVSGRSSSRKRRVLPRPSSLLPRNLERQLPAGQRGSAESEGRSGVSGRVGPRFARHGKGGDRLRDGTRDEATFPMLQQTRTKEEGEELSERLLLSSSNYNLPPCCYCYCILPRRVSSYEYIVIYEGGFPFPS